MISKRLGILIAIVIGTIAGGTAGATILSVDEGSARTTTNTATAAAYVPPAQMPSSAT
jgi:hypothetical protein